MYQRFGKKIGIRGAGEMAALLAGRIWQGWRDTFNVVMTLNRNGVDGRAVARGRVPLWFKVIYTIFCAILIPVYWNDYGPTNFLYYCDVALLLTLVALWMESALLVSAPAVGILLPQTLWAIDFLAAAVGVPITGMTSYMFNEKLPLFTRGLSFFHFWLPFVLVWLVWRLGYDRRAFNYWTAGAWALMLVCYFLMPAPPPSTQAPNVPVNINYVYGLNDQAAQTWMPPLAWLGLLLAALPVLIFYPTHRLLQRFAPAVPR